MTRIQSLLVCSYNLVNKTGLLETPLLQRGFSAAYFFYKRHLEDPFFKLSKRHPDLFQDGHVLDIGANIGYTTLVFTKSLAPGHQVFSFEPDPTNFKGLQKTLQRYGLSRRVVAMETAVGASVGSIELLTNPKHHADHHIKTKHLAASSEETSILVEMRSIDDLVQSGVIRGPVAFTKIDVQGYELEVLKGMECTLATNPTMSVAVEYSPQDMGKLGYHGADLLEFFESRGYSFWIIDRTGGLHKTDAAAIQARAAAHPYFDLLCRKKGV